MGYETRLIIGTDLGKMPDEEMNYLIIVATIDLCKSCFHHTYIDKDQDTIQAYFTGTNGENVKKDLYEDKLFLISPEKVLRMIKENNKGKNKYRRYNAAIPLLESLIRDFNNEKLKCILFGH